MDINLMDSIDTKKITDIATKILDLINKERESGSLKNGEVIMGIVTSLLGSIMLSVTENDIRIMMLDICINAINNQIKVLALELLFEDTEMDRSKMN